MIILPMILIPLVFILAGYFLHVLIARSKKHEFEKRGNMGHIPVFAYNVLLADGSEHKVLGASEEHVRRLVATPKQVLYHGNNAKPMHGINVTTDKIQSINLDRSLDSLVIKLRLAKP